MSIAVIPARGGSKRIFRKNVKEFCGKPAIAWTIIAAKESGLFDRIIVSTDDDEISDVAIHWGADKVLARPSDLSDDLTPTVPVIAHAIEAVAHFGWPSLDYVCCIYPCAPLIQSSDLILAFNLLKAEGVDYVYPVTEYPHPIQRAMRQITGGKMQFLSPEFELSRTQDLDKSFHDAGQFYWGKTSSWLEQKKMHSAGVGMIIPSWRVVDIDSTEDWIRAELIFHALNKQIIKKV